MENGFRSTRTSTTYSTGVSTLFGSIEGSSANCTGRGIGGDTSSGVLALPGGGAGTDAAPEDVGRCPKRWSIVRVLAARVDWRRETRGVIGLSWLLERGIDNKGGRGCDEYTSNHLPCCQCFGAPIGLHSGTCSCQVACNNPILPIVPSRNNPPL